METKVCIECSIKKPLSDFYFNEKRQSYNKVCRTCEYLIRKQREQSEKSSIKKKLQEENEELLKHSKKKCNICLQIKDLSEFYYRKEQQRYRNECKLCILQKQKENRDVKSIEKKRIKAIEKANKTIPKSKICSKCNIEKPLNEFRTNKSGYIFTVCKQCEYNLNMQRYYKRKMQDNHYKAIYEAKLEQDKLLKEHKKKCLICFEIKDLSEFYYRSDLKQYRNWCIECEKKRTNRFYTENKETILKKQHQFYKDNQKIMLERKKEYAKSHKNQLRTYHRNYIHNRRKNDDIFRFKSQIRHLINQSFRRQGKQKKGKTEKIVGCDFQTLYYYLLDTYKQIYGIEWDGIEKVHIDHIIPLATANTEQEIIELCHYTNLQLLKEKDNLEKNDKLDWNLK